MKICWNNLEKLEYIQSKEGWQHKKHPSAFYIYKEFCKNCGEPFLGRKYEINNYCSLSCVNISMKGKPKSDEQKKKMSESHKDMLFSEKHKQHMREVRKGIIFSEKWRQNLSKAKSLDNHPNWKGGISCEPYCAAWLDKEYKESIKERDGYKCLNPCCSKNSERLCIHHINYIKKDCSPFNLITLCVSCNTKANSDREWHKAWYKIIIQKRYK